MDRLEFIENLKKRFATLEKIKEELRAERELLKAEIENSAEYLQLSEEIKAIKARQEQLTENNSIIQDIKEKIKEANQEYTEIKEILSAELVNYYRENNDDQIEADGKIYRIKVTAKIEKTNQQRLFNPAS